MCTVPTDSPREHQYTAMVNVRNTELTAYWARYNIQAILNIGLMAAMLSSKPNSIMRQYMMYIAPIGIILSIIWLAFITCGKRILTKRWERYIIRYENDYLPIQHRLFANVHAEEEKKETEWYLKIWGWFITNLRNLNILACSIPIVSLLGWAAVIWCVHPRGDCP
jgi:hypothetical protein